MTPQTAAPAFFFYSPDPNPESRQHGRFIPQQHPGLAPMNMLPIVAPLPSSTPAVYSRPGSSASCSQQQQQQQPPLLPKGAYAGCVPILPSTMVASPMPMPVAHKPAIVLDTELCEEGLYSPATPPLSSSGSAISSPGSCDMLQTPLNPMFSGLDGKDARGLDELERFPALDWSACASPPLTPGTLQSFFLFLFFLKNECQWWWVHSWWCHCFWSRWHCVVCVPRRRLGAVGENVGPCFAQG